MKTKNVCEACGKKLDYGRHCPGGCEPQLTHTPTPWKIDCMDDEDFISGSDGDEVVRLYHYPSERNKEDAAFIVRAVNAHEELVKAIKKALEANNLKDNNVLIEDILEQALKSVEEK